MAGADSNRAPRARRGRPGAGLVLFAGVALALTLTARAQAPTAVNVEASRLDDAGRFREAAELLERGFDEALAGEPYMVSGWRAFFASRAAEFRTASGGWSRALEHLAAFGHHRDELLAAYDDLVATQGPEGPAVRTARDWVTWIDQLSCSVAGYTCQLYTRTGHLGLARRWLATMGERIAQRLRAGDDLSQELGQLYFHRMNLALAENDFNAAERAFEEGRDAIADPEVLAAVRIRYARALNELERRDPSLKRRARDEISTALETVTAENSRTEWERALLLRAQIDIREERHGAAAKTLETVAAGIRSADSKHYLRLVTLRVRLALAAGTEEEVDALAADVDDVFASFLAGWRRAELRAGGYGILQYGIAQSFLSERFRLALRRHAEPEAVRRCLADLAAVHSIGTLSRRMGRAPIEPGTWSVPDLEPGHGLLVFLPSNERSHLFVVDATGGSHVELSMADRIDEARRLVVASFADVHGASEASSSRAALADLAEHLLPATLSERMRGWSSVSVVGLDTLGKLPFEALPLPGGRAVGLELAVDVVPLLGFLGRPAPALLEPGAFWLVSDPDSPVRPLAFGAEALADVASAAAPCTAHVWDGGDASADVLRRTELGAVRMLAILAHGVQDPEREVPRGIALAPAAAAADGVLWVTDAAELAGAPPLVVLAACRSGASPIRRGDPSSADFAGAFLQSGARAVVTSEFDLDSEAARRLTRELVRGVAAGMDPAEALRDARRELASDPRFDDPFYWGTLRVIGRGQQPILVPAGPNVRVVVASGLALACFGLALFARRRRVRGC